MIRDGLARLALPLPVISEESADLAGASIAAPSLILVDPLDGTREFIAGRDEYTINIGLVADGTRRRHYHGAGARAHLARRRRPWRRAAAIFRRKNFSAGEDPNAAPPRRRPLVIVASRSHLDARTEAYLERLPGARRVASGSALKFCRVAEGAADHYPRLGPTHDWDVAAGHAIVAAAGGCVVGRPAGRSLTAARG